MTKEERIQYIKDELISKGLEQKYNHPGIYCITLEGNIVYVGKSRNMLDRISNHIYCIETDEEVNKYRVLHSALEGGFSLGFDVLYVSTQEEPGAIDDDIGWREGEEIRARRPILNFQIPKEENYHRFKANHRAKKVKLKDILQGEY